MIPLLIIFLSTSCLEPKLSDASSASEIAPVSSISTFEEKIRTVFHTVSEKALYLSVSGAFGSASLLAKLGWGISQLYHGISTTGNELLLLSHLCGTTAEYAFNQMLEGFHSPFTLFKNVPPSQQSWHLNQVQLSQIPAFSNEEKKLLSFLEKHWLAKQTGFFSSMVDWVCPCFGFFVQVHPDTSHSYTRSPWLGVSETYTIRVEAWKQSLPHPKNFPLILTRPCDLKDYLPSCLAVPHNEKVQTTVERAAVKMQPSSKVVIDLTHLFPEDAQEKWAQIWEDYRIQFSQSCKERNIDSEQIFCIQRMQQEQIGGIRLLPLANHSAEKIKQDHLFLLEWISNLGLSANRIELDRWPLSSEAMERKASTISMKSHSKQEFVSLLNYFDQKWNSSHPQKNLMFKGTVEVLKGLIENLSEDKWNEIANCPTRSSIAQLSFIKIKEQLELLTNQKEKTPFFDMASNIEQIHANISSLLEVFSPFTANDFSAIYRDILTSIPKDLKPLTSYGIHASGMTSYAGIFKAVEKSIGKKPRVLFGDNTYWECINTARMVSNASFINAATEKDWEDVDLIIAQFNPVLKRIELTPSEYKVENIAEVLHRTLNVRNGKPLTLALDCTIDFINSPRITSLLSEFQKEIEKGDLNIISFRSGLKFDLFGMDNYCGAPLYMIHNQDPKWAAFDTLTTDPALQTDLLSINWFCVAYQHVASQLELYRKQIFDNTRSLLNKMPSRLLYDQNVDYRVIPFDQATDPAFIDIKISGPFHQLRGAALVGGCLYLKCMQGGHPIFYRPSIGFYHPNFIMLFTEERTTIRLTLGLDPAQIDLLAGCFEMIDALNGAPWKVLDHLTHNVPFPALSDSKDIR